MIEKLSEFLPYTLQGRNPDNFSFIFWEKRWLHKFILKFTDLYRVHHNFFNTNDLFMTWVHQFWFPKCHDFFVDLFSIFEPMRAGFHNQIERKKKLNLFCFVNNSWTFIIRNWWNHLVNSSIKFKYFFSKSLLDWTPIILWLFHWFLFNRNIFIFRVGLKILNSCEW